MHTVTTGWHMDFRVPVPDPMHLKQVQNTLDDKEAFRQALISELHLDDKVQLTW